MKAVHHTPPNSKMTSNVCLTNTPKPKDIEFTITKKKKIFNPNKGEAGNRDLM